MYNTIMMKNKILSFSLFFIITFSASFIGGLVTTTLKEPWYSTLIKSQFNPPDWVFAPIWTILYFIMTLAIWKYWHSKNRNIGTVYIYFIHLAVNTTWSIIFFGFHKIFFSLVILVILILLIIILIIRFKSVNNLSFLLMIPYLLWCIYALFLNTSLFVLN